VTPFTDSFAGPKAIPALKRIDLRRGCFFFSQRRTAKRAKEMIFYSAALAFFAP
jgi:hypothetical protein